MRNETGAQWWILHGTRRHRARLRLVCFPYAGGNAALFRSWRAGLPDDVEVCAIQLPGRVNRIRERPYKDVAQLVPDLTAALRPIFDRPVALFGHSLGAIIAFELARWLTYRIEQPPVHLFVSGRRAPQIAITDPPSYNLSDADFVAKLIELNGTSVEVLVHDEMLELMLPTLRADFQMAETYAYAPGPPLTCPITAFGANDDKESLADRLNAWQGQTHSSFVAHTFTGDHFFIHSREHEILSIVRTALTRMFERTAARSGASTVH